MGIGHRRLSTKEKHKGVCLASQTDTKPRRRRFLVALSFAQGSTDVLHILGACAPAAAGQARDRTSIPLSEVQASLAMTGWLLRTNAHFTLHIAPSTLTSSHHLETGSQAQSRPQLSTCRP